MIGKIDFEADAGPQTLVLEDDHSVTCDNEIVQRVFMRSLARHGQEYSPSMGAWGIMPLQSLTGELNGKLTLEEKEKPEAPHGQPIY